MANDLRFIFLDDIETLHNNVHTFEAPPARAPNVGAVRQHQKVKEQKHAVSNAGFLY